MFCKNCGNKLNGKKFCTNCGHENKDIKLGNTTELEKVFGIEDDNLEEQEKNGLKNSTSNENKVYEAQDEDISNNNDKKIMDEDEDDFNYRDFFNDDLNS